MTMLTGKTIVLGITGSIAAFKAADLASKLFQAKAKVRVVMTESATKLIAPMTLRSLTTNEVYIDMFTSYTEPRAVHIGLAESADVVVIAPATADVIAKIVTGIADDILTCLVLATKAPVIIAPAMHAAMWEKPITQENIAKLKARGFIIIEPEYGALASGGTGPGRLVEIDKIIGTIRQVLGRKGDFAGKRVVVTAGGTQEAIDPVRFIGNRSSGKMGYALAEAARDRGATVTLISAPTSLSSPVGVEVIKVMSASEMKSAVDKAVAQADALLMAAAVADYQPKAVAKDKIKKDSTSLTIELVRTPDILGEVKGNFIKVGFAAESQNLVENARKKLESKKLDLIVANDITEPDSGFGSNTNRVTLIGKDGKVEALPLLPKRELADKILDRVVGLFGR